MTSVMVTALLAMIQTVLNSTGLTSNVLTSIINTLEQLVPLILEVAPEAATDVKEIITLVKDNTETPAELMSTVAGLDAQADAAVDAAAAADGLSTDTSGAAATS